MAKVIMIQGTMSNVGKSYIVAGLCRLFANDGYKVSPFKSQNMALNSYVTEDGLEMGRAQVMQAEAAYVKPSVLMNPILLKPTDHIGSQVIVNGEVVANMKAREYFSYKTKLIPDIMKAFNELSAVNDIIVIEGAGSPAEINLRENDIVNMGLANLVDAPVLLVGDIDRGGVFAQLLGTLELLRPDERERVKGLIINMFRGDKTILDPGILMLEEMGKVPVVGTVPYIDLLLEDEDSLSRRFSQKTRCDIDICVIKYPRISNFTDYNIFEQIEGVSVRYVSNEFELGDPDMIILPGSKNTISDLLWMRSNGIEDAVKKYALRGKPVLGICGGYQMLGQTINDPDNMESLSNAKVEGLGLLPCDSVIKDSKKRKQYEGKLMSSVGIFQGIENLSINGYEIHMGETVLNNNSLVKVYPFTEFDTGYCTENVYGTYVHGFLDRADIVRAIVHNLAKDKGVTIDLNNVMDYKAIKDREYDRLADALREHMDIEYIYNLMGIDRK